MLSLTFPILSQESSPLVLAEKQLKRCLRSRKEKLLVHSLSLFLPTCKCVLAGFLAFLPTSSLLPDSAFGRFRCDRVSPLRKSCCNSQASLALVAPTQSVTLPRVCLCSPSGPTLSTLVVPSSLWFLAPGPQGLSLPSLLGSPVSLL